MSKRGRTRVMPAVRSAEGWPVTAPRLTPSTRSAKRTTALRPGSSSLGSTPARIRMTSPRPSPDGATSPPGPPVVRNVTG